MQDLPTASSGGMALQAALTLAAFFVLALAPAGFALLTSGLTRRKNATHLVMLNVAAYAFTGLAYYVAGYAFQFGGTTALGRFLVGGGSWGLLGGQGFFLSGPAHDPGVAALVLLRGAMATTTGLILVGAICERVTFWAFVACEVFLAGLLYPIVGCWIWGGGWLSRIGASWGLGHGLVDAGGAAAIHTVGGFAALALCVVLGPRIGKFGPRGEPRAFPAHNVVYVAVGALLVACALLAINVGTGLGAGDGRFTLVAVNTVIAGSAGSAAAVVFWFSAYGVPDVTMASSGLLAGMVSVSACCAFVGPNTAALIGLAGGALASGGVLFNERVLRLDDPSGAVAVHGYCGWFGTVALGLFADGSYGRGWNGIGASAGVTGLFHGDASQLAAQAAGATIAALVAFGATWVVFRIANGIRPLRVAADVEIEGLDLAEFGVLAYSDEDTPSA